jgi:glycogen operon protein
VAVAQTTQPQELFRRGARSLGTIAEATAANKLGQRPSSRNVFIAPGYALPLGVRDCCDGFNFAVFSRHAERIELLLFDRPDCTEPFLIVELDPVHHRTGDIWHALIQGLEWGQAYAYRVRGPWDPRHGMRFDGGHWLLDPYALAVANTAGWRNRAAPLHQPKGIPLRPLASAAKGLLTRRSFDWQGIARPRRSWSETVIYETHVRGLTIHPSSATKHPGTFLGLIEKIPYLKDLDVTAVELMPVQEFAEIDDARTNPITGETLRNYWGYNTVAFFAPKEAYSTQAAPGCQIDEFKLMVRELHRAGIELILDIAFNHTAEGDEAGPTFSFRGLDNSIYYLLDEEGQYLDFTGCKNTLNCGHPVVRDYIIDCLRYWTTEMHVDGFRFDLASVLGRDERGKLLSDPPLIARIAEDPVLRDVKLIAEAWDMGGAFQVGSFPSSRWVEWNSHYRDDVRRFWFGDRRARGAFASRLCGSSDLYKRSDDSRIRSVNFVTCHDGLTLNDVVTYSRKHNEANGSNNLDGVNGEISSNHGREGEPDDPAIERVRVRQIKNLLATLMLSRGIPMLLGGDEFRRTQKGNNNPYCQDNETSWYDWRLLKQNSDIAQFTRQLSDLRRQSPVFRADQYYSESEVSWFDRDGKPVDWSAPGQTLGMLVKARTRSGSEDGRPSYCLLFNAGVQSVRFSVPPREAPLRWHVIIDTSDITEAARAPKHSDGEAYSLSGLAMALLELK